MSNPLSEIRDVISSWRAIACLLVFYYHTGFNLQLGGVVIQGFMGVAMFFVLSGYLLFKPMCSSIQIGRAFDVSSYLIRRVCRIYPAYFCALIFYSIARLIQHNHSVTSWSFFVHLLMIFNLSSKEFIAINIAFWTLALEMQFYLLLPMLFFAIKKPSKFSALFWSVIFILIGLVSRAIEMYLTQDYPNPEGIRFRFITSYLDLFGSGMSLAYLDVVLDKKVILQDRLFYSMFCVGLVGVIGANVMFAASGNNSINVGNSDLSLWLFPTLLSVSCAVTLFALVRGISLVCELLSNSVLVFIGEVSYSLYLYHIGVQIIMFHFYVPKVANYTAQCFLAGTLFLPPALFVSWISYRFIELPGINLAKRITSR